MGLGLIGFIMDSVGGVMFAKFLNLFRKEKINPMVGAAGISAFPMASRVVQKLATEAVSYTHLDVYKRQLQNHRMHSHAGTSATYMTCCNPCCGQKCELDIRSDSNSPTHRCSCLLYTSRCV